MFKVDFSFKGLIDQLNKIASKAVPNIRQRLDRSALTFIGDIQRTQMSGRRGRRYTNVVTGMLRRDWFHRIQQRGKDMAVEVYSTTPYARYQEYGTSKMQRRLYVREAWERNGIKSLRSSIVDGIRSLEK